VDDRVLTDLLDRSLVVGVPPAITVRSRPFGRIFFLVVCKGV